MKTSLKDFFHISSMPEVMTPFFWLYNVFGICTLQLNTRNLRSSCISVASLIINILSGAGGLAYVLTSDRNTKNFRILEVGTTLLLIYSIFNSIFVMTLNFGTRSYIRKLIQAFARHDKIAEKLFKLNHQRTFLVLLIFWSVNNFLLFTNAFLALQRHLIAFF